jgi:pyruvate/2-oxoglutarate/acetoin dehydrogenase E1 component
VPEGDHVVPIGAAAVAREGGDVTLVAWGAAANRALAAAETLGEEHGISAEVVDLRSLSPLDTDAILASLAKTGRLVVVHDAVGPFGGGAEIAALAASDGFDTLKAPVRRVTAPFAHVPFSREHEAAYFPQASDVVRAVRQTVGELAGR